jgi:hypothetical protein
LVLNFKDRLPPEFDELEVLRGDHRSSFGLRIVGLHDLKTGAMYPIIVYQETDLR